VTPQRRARCPRIRGFAGWGAAAVSFVKWPHGGFLQILVEIEYRGALDTKYTTSLEANYAVPDANIPGRSTMPMDIRRAEAT